MNQRTVFPHMQSDEANRTPNCSPIGPGDGSEDLSLGQRLASLWSQGQLAAFYATVMDELTPRIHSYLRRKGLSEEDCEDCMSQALEGFVERQDKDRPSINNPQAYIWRSAINASTDLLKGRHQERHALERIAYEQLCSNRAGRVQPTDTEQEPDEEQVPAILERTAVHLVEALVEDVQVQGAWAVQVVTIAVGRLKPALRRVANHILRYGPDYEATRAPADLGMPALTYRSSKSKIFKELRRTIPTIMIELGIDPARLGVPDLGLVEPRSFPSEEENRSE